MKALTIRQPWAAAIFLPDHAKDVENRSQRTQVTGIVAIHAGLRWDDEGQRTVFDLTRRMYIQAATGAVLGLVRGAGSAPGPVLRRRGDRVRCQRGGGAGRGAGGDPARPRDAPAVTGMSHVPGIVRIAPVTSAAPPEHQVSR